MTQQISTIEMPAGVLAALREVVAFMASAPVTANSDSEIARVIAELKSEIAALRSEVAQLRGSSPVAPAPSQERVQEQDGEHYEVAASIIDMTALSALLAEMYITLQRPHSKGLVDEYAAQLDELYALYETLTEGGITSHEISAILDMSYRQARPYPLCLKAPLTFSAIK